MCIKTICKMKGNFLKSSVSTQRSKNELTFMGIREVTIEHKTGI